MIQPTAFRMNEQTAVNNHFQKNSDDTSSKIQEQALLEFNRLAQKLSDKGINVIVVEDETPSKSPDSIFPNNWISFHKNGAVCLYPMFAENRRLERREDILEILETKGFTIKDIIDYTEAEEDDIFLEGTGSFVLDREHGIAYCSLSPRADEELFIEFCEDMEYTPVVFSSHQEVDGKKSAIYHTNVMMSVGKTYAMVCFDVIESQKEQKDLTRSLKNSGKDIISITEDQLNNFAGNTLQVSNEEGTDFIVMSSATYNALDKTQIRQIEKHSEIIHSDISTIEVCGGGSVRCMMAEVFLPKTTV